MALKPGLWPLELLPMPQRPPPPPSCRGFKGILNPASNFSQSWDMIVIKVRASGISEAMQVWVKYSTHPAGASMALTGA